MAMVFCRGCGKEIHETAPTCPHCGAPQLLAAKSSPTVASQAAVQPETVSAGWQRKFALIEKAGGPKLPQSKALSFGERMKVVFNVWGFLVGPLYYLLKGMWKKAIVLTLIAFAIILVLELLLQAMQMSDLSTYFVAPAIFGSRATIDYYKKVVRGDNGWW